MDDFEVHHDASGRLPNHLRVLRYPSIVADDTFAVTGDVKRVTALPAWFEGELMRSPPVGHLLKSSRPAVAKSQNVPVGGFAG